MINVVKVNKYYKLLYFFSVKKLCLLNVIINLLINIIPSVDGFKDTYIKEDIYFEIIEPDTLHYTYKVRPAHEFGTPFNGSFHSIGLVLTEPASGCNIPMNKLELHNNIALMDRGSCSFLSKCINAEKVGVVAVIIADNDISNDDQYIDMVTDTTDRNCSVPAMFLLGKDGYMIKRSLRTLNLTRAIINIPINMTYVFPHDQKQPPWVLW
ncbi:PRADC1-like protein [Parasteatoda tepidariorum]|nr:PRADC1-like protein [Parasteatoda tepidariorum]